LIKHDYKIREHNIRPHVDIEVDIMAKQNGLMTFTLRVNGGNIVDYSPVEYINVKERYGEISRLEAEVKRKPKDERPAH